MTMEKKANSMRTVKQGRGFTLMELLATENVLKQAELLADDWAVPEQVV